MKNNDRKKTWIFNGSIFLFLIGIGIFIGYTTKNTNNYNNIDENIFTNPVLDTSIGKDIRETKNINLEEYFNEYSNKKIANGDIINLSIYFRDLNNGNRFGTEEREMFSPASLMKLPLLLAYYKEAEYNSGILQKKLTFIRDVSMEEYTQNIPPTERLESGKEYTIEEIIEQMIKYSDNEASIFLERNINTDYFKNVFKDVGINFPEMISGNFDNNIKVVDYASFFRVLFNASYLNKTNSEKVLLLLTKTEFKDGLIAGVHDTNINISHKFGERGIVGNNGIERKQLHDCGIVYYPNHPYILCMMTRGYDWKTLKTTLQEVSYIVYSKMEETYNK